MLLTLAVPVALQVGTLLALVYVVFVCLGLALMRGRRADISPAVANSPWTCEIAWKPGYVRSRFQAVIVTPDDHRRRVVAESSGLRWPPQDVRNPPTREIEATLEALTSAIVASGWEPVPSPGSWSQRRFIWRRPGEPPRGDECHLEHPYRA